MPSGLDSLAALILEAGRQVAKSFAREWQTPVLLPALRHTEVDAEAGLAHGSARYNQAAVAYDGASTYLPFTSNVSFINSNGLSTDIVIVS